MGWKNWPYWLKGGLIFTMLVLLVTFIIGLIAVISYSNIPFSGKDIFLIYFIIIYLFPSYSLLNVLKSSPGSFLEGNIITAIITSSVIWFLIGALIGFVIGKIKSSRKRGGK